LLERMLRMLSVDEFAVLVGSTITQQALQQLTIREPQSLTEATLALEQHVRALKLVREVPTAFKHNIPEASGAPKSQS
jgi:hypothetical protein